MNNYVNVLEIQNKYARLLIGCILDNEVKVVYTNEVELSVPFVDGDILDVGTLTKDIAKLKYIEDKDLSFKYEVNDVILVVPPFGLEVFEALKSTNTTSQNSKINKLDIDNAFSLIKRERLQNRGNTIVNVIPKAFYTEGNKIFLKSPIGITSSYVSLNANVYTLPAKMIFDLTKATKNASIKVKQILVSSLCAVEVLNCKNYKYKDYIFINYSEKTTVLSLINNKKVIASAYFGNGSDSLIKKVENEFKISNDEAYRIVRTFGYDSSDNSYNPPIIRTSSDPLTLKFNKNNLNTFTGEYYKEWCGYLASSISTLLKDNPSYVKTIPLVFVGKGLQINGLKDYILRMFSSNTVDFIKSNVVGANYNCYINSIGAILLDDTLNSYFNEEINENRIEVTLSKEGEK